MQKVKLPPQSIIFGASGMVGYYFDESIPSFQRSNGYDVRDKKVIDSIFEEYRPKYVIHLAAETDVMKAENNPADCFMINTYATYWIAFNCKKYGAKLVFISSVDIYDGEKGGYVNSDVPNPIVNYGHSKLAAEAIIEKLLPNQYIICRAGWMFGGFEKDKKFVSYIVKFIKEGRDLQAVDDKYGTPTYAKDLAEKIAKLLTANRVGTYNICSYDVCSRYDEAVIISNSWGYSKKVTPVSASSFPNFRSLNNASMKPTELFEHASWKNQMKEYIKEWRSR